MYNAFCSGSPTLWVIGLSCTRTCSACSRSLSCWSGFGGGELSIPTQPTFAQSQRIGISVNGQPVIMTVNDIIRYCLVARLINGHWKHICNDSACLKTNIGLTDRSRGFSTILSLCKFMVMRPFTGVLCHKT